MEAWQATVQDEFGNAVFNPQITVYESDGVTLASIYNEDGSPKENPFTGSLEGFAQFWAGPGIYKIRGANGGQTELWESDLGGLGVAEQAVMQISDMKRPEGMDVYIPTDYPTIQEALEGTYDKFVGPDHYVNVVIEAGHQLTHGVKLIGGDWSRYRIVSEDPVVRTVESGFVSVDSSAVPESTRALIFLEDCRGPRLSCLIRGWGGGDYDGLILCRGAHIRVDEGCGITNTRMNCEVREGASIAANGTIWDDALRSCMRLTNGASYSIARARFHRGWKAWDQFEGRSNLDSSLHISRGSFGQAGSVDIAESGAIHVNVRRCMASLRGAVFGTKDLVTGLGRQRIAGIMDGGILALGGDATYLGSPVTPDNFGVEGFNLPASGGIVFSPESPSASDQITVRAIDEIVNSIIPSSTSTFQIHGHTWTPDGLMRIWGNAEFSGQDLTVASGAIYRTANEISITFPTTPGSRPQFIGGLNPVVSVTPRNSNPTAWPLNVTTSPSGFNVMFASPISSANATIRFTWEAVGRWQ